MRQIPDDPIIRCMERTGYPPWIDPDYEEPEEDSEEDLGEEEEE